MKKNLKNLLRPFLKSDDHWKLTLLNDWNTVIGTVASKVHLETVNDDNLILGVYDSCWMHELYMLSPLLLRTINKSLDSPRIKHLRFKKLGTRKTTQSSCPTRTYKEKKSIILTQSEKRALDKIKDKQLSAALKNFLVRCYQEKE